MRETNSFKFKGKKTSKSRSNTPRVLKKKITKESHKTSSLTKKKKIKSDLAKNKWIKKGWNYREKNGKKKSVTYLDLADMLIMRRNSKLKKFAVSNKERERQELG